MDQPTSKRKPTISIVFVLVKPIHIVLQLCSIKIQNKKKESKTWTHIDLERPPNTRSGSVSWVYDNCFYILGGFRGEGGFDYLVDLWKINPEEQEWTELDCEGSLPVSARATPSPVIDPDTGIAWFYGGITFVFVFGSNKIIFLDL